MTSTYTPSIVIGLAITEKTNFEIKEGKLGLFVCPSVCQNGSGSVKKDGKLPGVWVGALALALDLHCTKYTSDPLVCALFEG